MADMNFMDIFFGGGDTFSHVEKDMIQKKDDENLEWISDDFLDSILKSCTEDSNPILEQFLNPETESLNTFNAEYSSDSGLSYDTHASPGRSIKTEDDLCLNDALLETDSLMYSIEDSTKDDINEGNEKTGNLCEVQSFDTVAYVKEEEVECEEVFDSIYFDDSSQAGHETFIIQSVNTSDDDSNDVDNSHCSSPNSISDSKDEPHAIVKGDLRSRSIRSKVSNYSTTQRLQSKRKFSEISEENTSDDSDVIYPRLNLTPEEHKLAMKEGIKLPSHYPLTKIEERELKRIRRKIRNKISAQDSRRRKKEYVDGLEERVKRTCEENADLMKRIKTLESQKMTLVAQVKKLQASLARCSGQTAPSSTCLLVFVMSLALILAPNLRNTPVSSDNTDDEGISLNEEGATSPGRSSSRNLLFAPRSHEEQTNFSEEAKILTEQLEKMQLPDAHILSSVMEMLKLGKSDSLLKDHDYFRPRKRLASETIGDESWPPPKILSRMASELKNMASTFVIDKKKEQVKEPVIIDLLSD